MLYWVAVFLQRKCACGQHSLGGGECIECSNKKKLTQPLQTKLRIGKANDSYEQEADSLSEQIMRMPEPNLGRKQNGIIASPLVQRRASRSTSGLDEAPPIVHEVLKSPGEPLHAATRAFFEPRFGHDFSHVRVHTGPQANESARAVNATAYTIGQNMVFDAGMYQPHSSRGSRLLAHELTHVAQQSTGVFSNGLQREAREGEEVPPRIGMSASIDGLTFHAPGKLTYKRGRKTAATLRFNSSKIIGSTVQARP